MRARFDSWLEDTKNETTNPCVSSGVDEFFSTGGKCDIYAGKDLPCFIDDWGAYITRLKGRPHSTSQICRERVASFLEHDQMLSTWEKSSTCRELATQAPEWIFLTAFSRKGQLGADLKKSRTWREVKEVIEKSTIKNNGDYLTSILLMEFLKKLGVSESASIRPSNGDVAATVMKNLGLSPGWITEDQHECMPAEGFTSKFLSMPPLKLDSKGHATSTSRTRDDNDGVHDSVATPYSILYMGGFACLIVCWMLLYRAFKGDRIHTSDSQSDSSRCLEMHAVD